MMWPLFVLEMPTSFEQLKASKIWGNRSTLPALRKAVHGNLNRLHWDTYPLRRMWIKSKNEIIETGREHCTGAFGPLPGTSW